MRSLLGWLLRLLKRVLFVAHVISSDAIIFFAGVEVLLMPIAHPALTIDDLSQLQLVWVDALIVNTFTRELLLLSLYKLLFIVGFRNELFFFCKFLGVSDKLDLVLSLDDSSPVNQSFSNFVQICERSLHIVLIKRWLDFDLVELSNHLEVQAALALSWAGSSLLLGLLALATSQSCENTLFFFDFAWSQNDSPFG